MYKKLALISLASLILGGCTLFPSREPAATNTSNPVPSVDPSSSPIESDYQYEQSQTTSSGSDLDSLEKDLNTTSIPDEDLSDILGE